MRLVGFAALLAGLIAGCSRPSVKECSADSSCPAGSRCVDGLCSYIGVSCSDILDIGASTGDGRYLVRPGGGAPFTVWCDMTTDGGGWTLVSWSGDVATGGVPYPGLAECPTLDCARGSAATRSLLEELIRTSTEFGKGHGVSTPAGSPGYFPQLGLYAEAGKYTYGSLAATRLAATGTCDAAGQLEGWFRSLTVQKTYDSVPVLLNLALASGTYDYTSDAATNPYVFTIGAPGDGCAAPSAMPGAWMGRLPPDHGPYATAWSGASSLWVRGGTAPAPPASCRDVRDGGAPLVDGLYWIRPGAGPAFQVQCDMTTDGGGWTVVYWVDAAGFDGVAANNALTSSMVPIASNSRSDIWNAESSFGFNETLFACTSGMGAKYFWQYNSDNPFTWLAQTTNQGNGFQNWFYSNRTNGLRATCLATDKAVAGSTHGFLALGGSTAGTCAACDANILYGAYHYTDATYCNLAPYITFGGHASGLRNITYPVCNGQQVNNGLFWIAVR